MLSDEPGEQPKQIDIIKLNTNECPYPPSPMVFEAMKNFDSEKLRLYPDPKAEKLVNAWADFCQLDPSEVFVGVGSDDVLSMCFLTFFHGDKPVIFPDITYSFYDVWCDVYRIPFEVKKLNEDFTICKEDYFCENGGVVLANPNAPTGIEADLSEIEEIIQKNQNSIVIIDEAYVDFGARSALPLIHKYHNVVVVQTFSKSRAMAGSRIGFAMANQELIRYMNDVKYSVNSYTMNMQAIEAGIAAIHDVEYLNKIVHRIVETREYVKEELRKIGFVFGDSSTNFIFAKHPDFSGDELFSMLRENNIIVRHFNKARIQDYL